MNKTKNKLNVLDTNKIINNKNINKCFFLYCLKNDLKLIIFFFYNAILFLYSFFMNNQTYEKNKFRYLKHVKNLNQKIKEFSSENKKKITLVDVDLLICRTPNIILKKLIKNNNISYSLDEDYRVMMDAFEKQISDLKIDNLYVGKRYYLNKYNNYENSFLVKRNSLKKIDINKHKKFKCFFGKSFLILFISGGITLMSFFYTHAVFEFKNLFLYFHVKLLLMNFLPVFLMALIFLFLTKSYSISFLLSSIIVFIHGIVNQTKLVYRDDVLKVEDLQLVKEASIMLKRYSIIIRPYTILFAIIIILFFVFLTKHLKKLKLKYYKSLIIALVLIGCSAFFGKFYLNESLYNNLGDQSKINVWISTRQSQIRGLIYPFVYSAKDISFKDPDYYSEKDALKIINKYQYSNIPKDKKVNIVGIMLEAYNDFSKFAELGLDSTVYDDFHFVQEKSIHGNLVTSIFGGGTVVTERGFLTGYDYIPSLRKSTNSFVWYFREQGYYTDGDHPIYGAFYNRRTVNNSLGFENYDYYEEAFSKYKGWGGYASDKEFIDYIIKQYEKNKNKPYFNFSVTYQNHGPYSGDNYDGKNYYFDNPGISETSYNIINQYLDGIKSTSKEIRRLVEYFENVKEPTIVVLFGDHNPYLENAYSELNINMDRSNIEGFENYYETPYIIYGNPAAKKLFNKSFEGEGETISPFFLMPELFDYLGFEGNEYMQYLIELKKQINVITTYYYKDNNEFVSAYDNKLVNDFKNVNYYVAKHFNSKVE